jgi:zinc and cadmium transporter
MDSSLLMLLLLSFLGSVAGLVGGIVFLLKRDWARTLSVYAVPFAAGVLLAVSVLHLIPEVAEELGSKGYFYVLLSFLGAFIFEKYFASLHHHEEHGHDSTLQKATIPLVILGDTIHNLIDGVAIAAAYITSPGFGVVVALSTFLHETPHEVGDFGVLISRGWSRKKTFMANFYSSLATIPGALLVYYFVPSGADQIIAVFLAVAAGIFLYLGASDFLPEIGEHDSRSMTFKKVFFVILGVALMYTLSVIFPRA